MIGIDFSSDLLISFQSTERMGKGEFTVIGSLKDPRAFNSFFTKMNEEKENIQTIGDAHIVFPKEFGPALAWNEKLFVISNVGNSKIQEEMMSFWKPDESITVSDTAVTMIDSVGTIAPPSAAVEENNEARKKLDEQIEAIMSKAREMITQNCLSILNGINANELSVNKNLNRIFEQDADIRTWSNGGGFFKNMSQLSPGFSGIFGKMEKILSSDKVTFANFENGKITGISHNYINEQQAAIYKKYPPITQNLELVTHIPSDTKLLALMNVSGNPEMGREILRGSGLADLLDSFKKELPFDPKLLQSTFGNSAMLAVVYSPSKEQKDEYSYQRSKNPFKGIEFLMAIPLTNKDNFKQLQAQIQTAINKWKAKMAAQDEENESNAARTGGMSSLFRNFKLSMEYNEKLCVISGSPDLVKAYMKNTGTTPVPDWLKETASFPVAMRFDLKEFMRSIYTAAGSPTGEKDLDALKMIEQFGAITIKGGDFNDGSINSRVEFSFSDKDRNSMEQLFTMVNMMASASFGKNRVQEQTLEENKQEGVKDEPPPPPSAISPNAPKDTKNKKEKN
jgi:hypothetical protein